MAKLMEEQYLASSKTSTNEKSSVGFFSLKNDGDKAVVRIMHDATTDFDVVSVHEVTVNGKSRKVSCLRTGKEPLDNCPLCKAGVKSSNKIFIHLVEYVKDEFGNIVAEPKIWERPIPYVYDLRDKINNYGPLSDVIFIITRHGKSGDRQTTYTIDFANPNMYKSENYPKIEDAFDGYSVIGGIVLEKGFDDMEEYVHTGEFPYHEAVLSDDYITTPAYDASQKSVKAPWDNNTTVQRPVRSY